MSVLPEASESLSIFISYAKEDEKMLKKLETHLSVLEQQGLITIWHTSKIAPGEVVKSEIGAHFAQARIILLLISPSFMSTGYYDSPEIKQAIQRHKAGEVSVIPLLLHPTAYLELTPLGELPALPTNGKPVTDWSKEDAFFDIARDFGKIVKKLRNREYEQPSTYRPLLWIPPPCDDPEKFLQREDAVHEIYTKLTHARTTAVVLTGIAGVGKSTLAGLVYYHARAQRYAGNTPFTGEELWLKATPAITMADVAGTLLEALGRPSIDFSKLAPERLAIELFSAFNTTHKPRLIIIDQFENLLDAQTRRGRQDRPGINDLLEFLNSQPCPCRILLTSRFHLQYDYPLSYLQEFFVHDLKVSEGIELLRKWGVETKEIELKRAVERCHGHPYALFLLQKLLKGDGNMPSFSISALLDDPAYVERWTIDMPYEVLNTIYIRQLNQVQREVLLAFSIYREPVPLEAIQAIKLPGSGVSKRQTLSARDGLYSQHLLLAAGNGYYGLHPVMADFARDHFVEDNEQANKEARYKAHSNAASYYQSLSAHNHLPKEQRQRISDIHDLVEATWHYCQAKQYAQAYALIVQENLFRDLLRWGGSTTLLELYKLLQDGWHIWLPEPAQTARIYNELGELYRMMGQHRIAQQYYEQALKLFHKIGQDNETATTLNNLGAVYRLQNQIDEAIACYEEARRIYQEMGNKIVGGGMTLNNLGKAMYDLGKQERGSKRKQQAQKYYQQALIYYEQALPLLKETGQADEEARTLSNIGEVYETMGQREQAYQYYQDALRRFQTIGERWGEGVVLNGLGKLCKEQGNLNGACPYYCKALDIFRVIGDRWDEGTVLKNLGRLYIAMPQPEQHAEIILACFSQAKEIFEELHSPEQGLMPPWIEATLRSKLENQQFEIVRADVEARALQIIEQNICKTRKNPLTTPISESQPNRSGLHRDNYQA